MKIARPAEQSVLRAIAAALYRSISRAGCAFRRLITLHTRSTDHCASSYRTHGGMRLYPDQFKQLD